MLHLKQLEIGQKFGRLTVVEYFGKPKNHHLWKCLCECGQERTIRGTSLLCGHTISCGCFNRDVITHHGMTHTPAFNAWTRMIQRCTNKKRHNYSRYGGRGIYVCDRWKSFVNFYADMGELPLGLTLERRNNDGPYSPDNCYWATPKQQANNRHNSKPIAFNGEIHNLKDWSLILKIDHRTLYSRIYQMGWDINKAFTLQPLPHSTSREPLPHTPDHHSI